MRARRLAALALTATLACVSQTGVAGASPQRGTAGDDRARLGAGADRYRALAGDDRVDGGAGADAIYGGSGADRLDGGRGADSMRGGPGGDRIDARDGTADELVAGGGGRDVCRIDRGVDEVRGCEVTKPAESPLPSDPEPDPAGDTADPADSVDPPAYSDAYLNRNWEPTAYDTCPESLHDSYSVVGPDGKLYPTWHPPTTTNPQTGETCTFGHEHGANPAGSDIFEWVASHLAASGYEDRAGLPFGYASERLVEYAAANPDTSTRFEDHVGHKIDYANDVALLDSEGNRVSAPGVGDVVCDYLTKVHQGSHSSDATANNAHELLYAARCNDGTQLISTTMTRFGAANEFNRSCAPEDTVNTGSSSPYPPGGGLRLIPDRACVEQYVLVPSSSSTASSDIWALYENWRSENVLRSASGDAIASFDPWFAVRNPSRYYSAPGVVGRTLDAAWETDASDDGRANRPPWTDVAALDPFEYRDPRSPFDGAQRDIYIGETEVTNDAGPERWYTDPYGENGQATPFAGAICQLVSASDNSAYPPLRRRLFGRDDDYGAANGVHAPN